MDHFSFVPSQPQPSPGSPARVQRSGSRGDVNIADNCFVDNTLFQLCAPRGAEPHTDTFTTGAAFYYTSFCFIFYRIVIDSCPLYLIIFQVRLWPSEYNCNCRLVKAPHCSGAAVAKSIVYDHAARRVQWPSSPLWIINQRSGVLKFCPAATHFCH